MSRARYATVSIMSVLNGAARRLIESSEDNETGMRHYLVVHGRASITEGGAPEVLHRLAQTYIAPGTAFPPMPDPPPGFVLRITPECFGGSGPWVMPQR